MKREKWGVANNREVELFTLGSPDGLVAKITNFGGAIVSLMAPDRNGDLADVVLGYDSLEEYIACTSSVGILVGRYANRIGNARFILNGKEYKLAANDGQNHLHGGPGGFSKQVWDAEIIQGENGEALQLSYFSKDGEEGYPGNLKVKVIYEVIGTELKISYQAQTDQDTIINLTNHSYFNLAGHDQGLVLDHNLKLNSDFYTPINEDVMTTGEIRQVAGTPLDFRTLTSVGKGIDADHEQIAFCGGYDHNWVIRREGPGLTKAARVEHAQTGRALEVWTTKPGIQFYSGNFLKNGPGKEGSQYPKWSGFCLETQYFPNSPNFPHFSCAVLKADEKYEHTTSFRFSKID